MAERDSFEERLSAHLSAPLPLRDGAADRVVATVRDRLDGTAPRRSPLPLLAGVASGVVLAGILAAALWARTVPHARPERTVPGVGLGVPTAPSTVGFAAADAAFGDDVHGWEVGTECTSNGPCRLAVRATSDGGRTWGTPSAVAPSPDGVTAESARVAFSGRTGFVAAGKLFTSTDGGRSWRDTGVVGDTVEVAPVGASVWALQSCGGAQRCPLRIVASADGGRSWAPLATQPPLAGPDAELIRVSAGVAFLSGSAPVSGGGSSLAATHDGGRTWEALADPCAPAGGSAAPAIAALEPTELWAACGSVTGDAGVAVFRSRDGGEHWQQLAIAGGPPGPGGDAARPAALALAPRGAAYLALEDGPLLRSGDGSDWRLALGAGAGVVRRIDLLDTTHGWVVTATGRVLRTSDGGRTWNATAS